MESVTSENITNEFLAFNQSQWTSNGSNIYLNSSVGIGTSLPRANLDVYGSINALSANFGTVYTGGTVFSSLNVSGNANIVGNLTVSNLIVTGNYVNVISNTQFSNAVTINNAGTSTALKVHQLESVPVHTNNVAEFWDYQTLALLINGDGNVGIHTTLINPHAFAVVGSSNIDYIKTINVYSSNAVVASNLYGNVVGSNTVSASGLYGPVVGSNTVSASGLYGPVVGSNTISGTTISGSILYGPLAGSNTIVGSTIYGPIAGSNTISASTIYGQLAGSNTIAGSSLTLGTALSVANGGTGLTSTSANFVFAGPTTGAAAAPTWRALVSADIPANAAATTGSAGSLSTNFTSGYVLYGQGTGVPAFSSGHYWDNTNSRLGLGTASPTSPLHIISSQTTTGNMVILDGSGQTTVDTGIRINSGAGKNPYIDFVQNGTLKGNIYWDNGSSRMVHNGQTTDNYFAGNVGIKISPGYTLDVDGTAHCSGILYVGNNSTATAAGSEGGKIYLGGTYGDSAFDHNVIVSRLYAATESAEMVLFKGNDASGGAGPDRIRLRAANICFDTYPSATTDYSATNIRMTINDSGYVNYTTSYKYNIFYAPANWSYSTTTLNAWSQLWSFTYNFPQASYVVATISGHWQCQTNGYAAYLGILIDGAAQQSSSLYDSYTVGGASSQGGYWHQYYNTSIAWHGFSHTVCIKVTAGNHTFGGGIYAFNANTYYMNGAAITLQVTPINYL